MIIVIGEINKVILIIFLTMNFCPLHIFIWKQQRNLKAYVYWKTIISVQVILVITNTVESLIEKDRFLELNSHWEVFYRRIYSM